MPCPCVTKDRKKKLEWAAANLAPHNFLSEGASGAPTPSVFPLLRCSSHLHSGAFDRSRRRHANRCPLCRGLWPGWQRQPPGIAICSLARPFVHAGFAFFYFIRHGSRSRFALFAWLARSTKLKMG